MERPTNLGMDGFFRPRGIAIVGASAKPGNPNNQIIEYAKQMGFKGNIYPVNPKAGQIAGLKSYPSILEVPTPTDLVVLVVPAQACLAVSKDIVKRRKEKGDVGSVVVITAGFKEMGSKEGQELQRSLVDTLNSVGARMIGPNCVGVVDTFYGINTTFSVPPNTPKGGVALVSQSGAFATSYLRWANDQKLVGINKFVSLGNMADVDIREMLAYLEHDEKTKVIAVYMEGINDARAMIETAAEVSKKKPIVVIKSGRTELGSGVANSHTASIAGNDAIYEGAFKQAGVIRAKSVAEFYHTARSFDKVPLPKGPRVCLLTVVGGPSTICVDELASSGEVQLAHLKDELKKKVSALLVPSANVGNPDGYIDMTASVTSKVHSQVLKLLMEDDDIDGIIFMTTPPGFLDQEELAAEILAGYNSVPPKKKKPLLTVMLAGNAVSKCRTILEENGLPTFEYPDDAAKVMVNLVRYSCYRRENS